MLTGYRNALIAIGALASALALGIGFQQLDYAERYQAATDHPRNKVGAPIPDRTRIADALESIRDDQQSTESSERGRRDLDAQEGAARWTKWSAWAAVVQLFLSAGGILLVVYSLRQGVNTDRPHVRFYRTVKDRGPRGALKGINGINFRNYGETPALVRSLALRFELAEKPPFPSAAGLPRIWPDDSIMPKDEEWPRKHWIPPFDGASLDGLITQHGNEGKRLFVFGELCYRDAFSNEHRTRFCRVWDGQNFTHSPSEMGGDARYNYSD